MTRDDLIRVLVDRNSHIHYKDMCMAVRVIIDSMVDTLNSGSRIEVRRFGSFSLRYRPSRLARNPKTGITLHTECKYTVHFKPGKELRERLNGANKEVR